jgi:hypothetical protein
VWFSARAPALTWARRRDRATGRAFRRAWPAEPVAAAGVDLGRRAFLRQMSVTGVALPFAASASGVSTSSTSASRREIVVPGWPRALDGLRVAHLSDIHRRRHGRANGCGVAELTNGCRPDLVATPAIS